VADRNVNISKGEGVRLVVGEIVPTKGKGKKRGGMRRKKLGSLDFTEVELAQGGDFGQNQDREREKKKKRGELVGGRGRRCPH